MKNFVYDIFAGIDKSYRVKSKVELAGESITLTPCPEFFDTVEEVMAKIPNVKLVPRIHCPSGSEDCALFLSRVIKNGGKKAAFILYGCNHKRPSPFEF